MNAVGRVYSGAEVAAMLGVSSETLLGWMRLGRYPFTQLKPGGKPGDRGPNRWGMTRAQVDAMVRGQARQLPEPVVAEAEARLVSALSPDGVSRLRRGGVRR